MLFFPKRRPSLFRGFLLFTAAALLIGAWLLYRNEQTGDHLREKLLRLHVVAVSDSEEDQAIKLHVRDAILEVTAPLLADCTSAKEAENLLQTQLPLLQKTAEKALKDAGKSDSVTVSLSEEYYPTKVYDTVTLPCGRYRSLRVELGDAEGKNWWCVLYPPLCLSAASVEESEETVISDTEEALLQAGLTKDETCLITGCEDGNFTLRFRFLELLGELKQKLFGDR